MIFEDKIHMLETVIDSLNDVWVLHDMAKVFRFEYEHDIIGREDFDMFEAMLQKRIMDIDSEYERHYDE